MQSDMKDWNTDKKQIYRKAVSLMKSISCMNTYKEKVDMYLMVAEQFSDLSGYKEADEYSIECKLLAEQTTNEILKITYERAVRYKNEAKVPVDFQSAADEFKKVSGYLDADDMASMCEQLGIKLENKTIKKSLINKGVVLICIIAVILGITTPYGKYGLGNASMSIGSYNLAINMYSKLGGFKDSKEKLMKSQYMSGQKFEAEEDYSSAEKAYAAAKNYKDSYEKSIEMKKSVIKNSQTGDIVSVGNSEWIILDMETDKVLLMKKVALSVRAYHSVKQNVTWENSTLRQELNSTFFDETFSEKERSNIIHANVNNSDNKVYGTEGGNDTKDYIFLLSIEEGEKYNSLFPKFKNNSWLRSPGNNQNSAAFLSVNGSVMDYGYEVTSEELTVRPVLWFNINE